VPDRSRRGSRGKALTFLLITEGKDRGGLSRDLEEKREIRKEGNGEEFKNPKLPVIRRGRAEVVRGRTWRKNTEGPWLNRNFSEGDGRKGSHH